MVSSGFLQEPHGVTTQKTPFFIVTAVKTSNLTFYKIIRECNKIRYVLNELDSMLLSFKYLKIRLKLVICLESVPLALLSFQINSLWTKL
jgi:hypothetical protein